MGITLTGFVRKRRRKKLEGILKAGLPSLYQTALSLCASTHDADDLLHDSCVKALRASDDAPVEDPAACQRWLRRILCNTFLDQYRHRQRSPFVDVQDADDNVIALTRSPVREPDHQFADDALIRATHAALLRLNPEARVAIVLYAQSGLDYQTIADIQGCPTGTVMSRIARARAQLREQLGPRLGGHEEWDNDQTG